MVDVDYGYIKVKLAEIIENQNISINKLAFRSETQRTQIKTYLHGDIQRVDLSVLARLCYALECDLSDILEYVPPQGIKS
ncbi:MAG: helix-turn-helix transcriptional regulator [Lachnospiraceae bacterium]|nr:helix-turn-helix transcriptional regulator [Lachnospiraceae bacterium]